MAAFTPVRPGDVIAGKYRVERVLGEGGMGVVIEATHIALNERVAIKFLKAGYALQSESVQRFLREARAAVRIKSPHVARVSDFGATESGVPYIVMEFLRGQDALGVLASQGKLSAEDALDIVIQACDALAEAHSLGIVHRDIKPANLFVSRHADGSSFVKVLDFGISKLTEGEDVSLTHTTAALGSAAYMSPEQMRQSRSVDLRTDIYSLGVTLFELLTLTRPFDGDSFAALAVEVATGTPKKLETLRPDLPPELARVVDRALARDPAQRHQNIGELALALAPWAPGSVQPLVQRIARLTGAAAPARAVPVQKATLPLPMPTQSAVAQTPAIASSAPAPGTSTTAQFAHAATPRAPSQVGIIVIVMAALAVVLVTVVTAVVVIGRGAATPAASEPSAAIESVAQPAAVGPPAASPLAQPAEQAPAPAPSGSVAAAVPAPGPRPATRAAPKHAQQPTPSVAAPAPPTPKKPEINLNER